MPEEEYVYSKPAESFIKPKKSHKKLIIIFLIIDVLVMSYLLYNNTSLLSFLHPMNPLIKALNEATNMPNFLIVEVTPSSISRNSTVQVKIYLSSNASDNTKVILNEDRYKFFILSLTKKIEEGTPEYQQGIRYVSWVGADDLFKDKNYLSGWSSSFFITKDTPYIFTFDIGSAINDYQNWKEIPGRTTYNLSIEGEYRLHLEGTVAYTEGNENTPKPKLIGTMSNPIIVS